MNLITITGLDFKSIMNKAENKLKISETRYANEPAQLLYLWSCGWFSACYCWGIDGTGYDCQTCCNSLQGNRLFKEGKYELAKA